jgi:hypothetical protein
MLYYTNMRFKCTTAYLYSRIWRGGGLLRRSLTTCCAITQLRDRSKSQEIDPILLNSGVE